MNIFETLSKHAVEYNIITIEYNIITKLFSNILLSSTYTVYQRFRLICCRLLVMASLVGKTISVSVGDSVIAQSSKVRDLSVIFDQFLNCDDYISGVCRSTHFPLRNIGRIRHLLSYDACAQVIHALISVCLDYCNSLLYNLPKGSIERLQKIQNQAARILTKTPRCEHISEVLVSLYWLRIEQRIIYKILILTFKAFVNHTATMYLSE